LTGTLHEDQYTFLSYRLVVIRMRNFSDKSCWKNETFYVQ